jgi:RNA polymerase sigma-70 factor (ECF subfamily)
VRGSSEERILKDIREGRRKAYEIAICRHYKPIYRFLAYLTNDAGVAEDLTQEVFSCAWADIGNYEGRASLKTWLHKIAYNKFIDSKRDLRRDVNLLNKMREITHQSQNGFSPFKRLIENERSYFLLDAIHKLESTNYTVILLHYIQGLSFQEMAEVLEEPVGTVKSRTSRALERLKSFLTGRL